MAAPAPAPLPLQRCVWLRVRLTRRDRVLTCVVVCSCVRRARPPTRHFAANPLYDPPSPTSRGSQCVMGPPLV